MQRKIKIALSWSFILLGVSIVLGYGIVYWWLNPHLTQMQLFVKNGLYFFSGVSFIIIGFKLME